MFLCLSVLLQNIKDTREKKKKNKTTNEHSATVVFLGGGESHGSPLRGMFDPCHLSSHWFYVTEQWEGWYFSSLWIKPNVGNWETNVLCSSTCFGCLISNITQSHTTCTHTHTLAIIYLFLSCRSNSWNPVYFMKIIWSCECGSIGEKGTFASHHFTSKTSCMTLGLDVASLVKNHKMFILIKLRYVNINICCFFNFTIMNRTLS